MKIPNIAVLDIKIPRRDGPDLLQKMRPKVSSPIIFLMSKDDEIQEVFILRLGGTYSRAAAMSASFSSDLAADEVKAHFQGEAQCPGFVKICDQLMDVAYDVQIYVGDGIIDSHIKRLNKKIWPAISQFASKHYPISVANILNIRQKYYRGIRYERSGCLLTSGLLIMHTKGKSSVLTRGHSVDMTQSTVPNGDWCSGLGLARYCSSRSGLSVLIWLPLRC